jgi:hypothetical protein
VSKPPNIEAAVLFRPIPQDASQAWGQVRRSAGLTARCKLRRPCVDDLAAVRCGHETKNAQVARMARPHVAVCWPWRLTMRKTILAVLGMVTVALPFPSGPVNAQNYPWCGQVWDGARKCGFVSYKQCRAGSSRCDRNPMYQPPTGQPTAQPRGIPGSGAPERRTALFKDCMRRAGYRPEAQRCGDARATGHFSGLETIACRYS